MCVYDPGRGYERAAATVSYAARLRIWLSQSCSVKSFDRPLGMARGLSLLPVPLAHYFRRLKSMRLRAPLPMQFSDSSAPFFAIDLCVPWCGVALIIEASCVEFSCDVDRGGLLSFLRHPHPPLDFKVLHHDVVNIAAQVRCRSVIPLCARGASGTSVACHAFKYCTRRLRHVLRGVWQHSLTRCC